MWLIGSPQRSSVPWPIRIRGLSLVVVPQQWSVLTTGAKVLYFFTDISLCHVVTQVQQISKPKIDAESPLYAVPSESIHTPGLFPHFVVLQPEFKME